MILAAGQSRRMRGADKLLLSVDGLPQLRHIALQALATGYRVLVAIPHDNPLRRAALKGLGVTIVYVQHPSEGMAAGLSAGYAAALDAGALMILPADMPDLTCADLNRVIAAHRAEPDAICRGATADLPGHPVILPGGLLPQLNTLAGDQGARQIIQQNQHLVRLIPLPEHHATLDLDTPEDWANWLDARAGRQAFQNEHPSMADPLAGALLCPDDAVLAVITRVDGPSYRRPGAMMCLFADGTSAGNLTNGCIEGDLALHARAAWRAGQVLNLRYGAGSPFFDIRLPCGGGLDVALFPRPEPGILAQIARKRAARDALSLCFARDGRLSLRGALPTHWDGDGFVVDLSPAVQVHIYGEGAEAVVFARLLQGAGIAHHLVTPSQATFAAALRSGCIATFGMTAPVSVDCRTAIVTFFHDHDRDLTILQNALHSPAFYIGAQGSRRVAAQRLETLRGLGVLQSDLDRLRGPIGLAPSSRHPQALAASVLAEILAISEP